MNFKLIAEKITNILNGVDSEIIALGLQNPTDFDFNVQTQGFHLDHITNNKKGTNFIPVFISSMGGQRNPVPNLRQGTYTLPIVFYFPVRFKDSLFALDDFLCDCFCGRRLNYGTDDAPLHCVSNISVAQFGEIQEIDVIKEFINWLENTYQTQIEITEPYISMQYTLYLSNADENIVYGNEVDADLSLDISTCGKKWVNGSPHIFDKGDLCVYKGALYKSNVYQSTSQFIADNWTLLDPIDEPVLFASGSIISSSQAVSEQEMGTNECQSLPLSTSYATSFTMNVSRDSDFYYVLLKNWVNGNIQRVRATLRIYIADTYTFVRTCFVESINMPILKGEPLTITISLAKAVDENDEEDE